MISCSTNSTAGTSLTELAVGDPPIAPANDGNAQFCACDDEIGEDTGNAFITVARCVCIHAFRRELDAMLTFPTTVL